MTQQQLPGFFSGVMPEMSLKKMGDVDGKEWRTSRVSELHMASTTLPALPNVNKSNV